jgi:hypothetical protein
MKPDANKDDDPMERLLARYPDLREGVEKSRAERLDAPDKMTTHLRTELRDHFAKVCRGMSAPAKDAVRRWIDQARVENLAEWLDTGDHWQALERRVESVMNPLLDSLQKCYAGRAVIYVIADITAENETDPDNPQRQSITIRSNNYTVRLAGEHNRPLFQDKTPEQREERRRQDERLGLKTPTDEDYTRERDLARQHAKNYPRQADWFDGLRVCVQERHWVELLDTADGVDRLRWLGWLARPWLEEYAKEQTELEERKANAKPLQRLPRTKVGEREFVRIGKVGAGISWAFGGHGVLLSSVDLDGKTFAPQADLAVVPAGIALLPADHANKPHQTVLALDDTGNADAPPLPLAIAQATRAGMTLHAAKLALYIMAGAISRRQPTTQTTIRELTERLNPGLDSRKMHNTHYQSVFSALAELDRQRLFFPNGFAYRAFECPLPWRELSPAEYDQEIYVGFARAFEAGLTAFLKENNSYRGDFLLELTGAMAIKSGGPLRQYVRATSAWNAYWRGDGEPDPAKVPVLSTEHWASLCNYLAPSAVEYLRTRDRARGGHVRTAEGVKKILKDAEELEAAGLVVIDKANREQIRLLPPDIYLEAWRKSRAGGEGQKKK